MALFICGLAITLAWLFHRLVTRHLLAMAEFSRHLGAGSWQQPLQLAKAARADDEIDQVAHALEDLRQAMLADLRRREADRQALVGRQDELQRMVEQRVDGSVGSDILQRLTLSVQRLILSVPRLALSVQRLTLSVQRLA